jgi:simple sugar transport system permease protein
MSGEATLLAALAVFTAATVRTAIPLLLAALGEVAAERSGVLYLGIEGSILCGALGAALGARSVGPHFGLLTGACAGLALAGLFVVTSVWLRADPILIGTALNLLAVGVTGAVYRGAFGIQGAGLTLPTLPARKLPLLFDLPIVGPAFFALPLVGYLALALVPISVWFLFHTAHGLAIQACGEAPEAARAAGISVPARRAICTLWGGALAGLAGAYLVLAYVGTFSEKMSAGRGFIAIAIVVLGRWHPVGALIGALLFGGFNALQFLFQALGVAIPYQLLLMVPYAMTLVAMVGALRRSRAPAALGKP